MVTAQLEDRKGRRGRVDEGRYTPALEMARPVITPLSIHPTAPETFSVLEQRMRMAEEQAGSLISDLRALGINSQRLATNEFEHKTSSGLQPISPIRVRPVFTGDAETLWRNCESLVNRMCHLESMLQTLKLNVFRLHTDREIHTKHSGELDQRLQEMQAEHAWEMKDTQLEIMRLRQRLNNAEEDVEREVQAKDRLSAALEIATTTKMDIVVAAEEMKATKFRMSQRLTELQDKLSQEAALRALLEEEQGTLLLTVQGLKNIVEEEQAQVQELQEKCHTLQKEGPEVKDKLKQEKSRCEQLEKESKQFQAELEEKDSCLIQLQNELKIIGQKREAEKVELSQMQHDSVTLREAAEKVQSLNQQLEGQCTELTATVEKLTNENLQLKAQHQQNLMIMQDSMTQKLHQHEVVLSTVQTSLNEELQTLYSHQTILERDLENLRAEHLECQRKVALAEQKNYVQKEIHNSAIACLRADLDSALKEKAALETEKTLLQEELAKIHSDFQEKEETLEVQVTENKLELGSLHASLLAQEQENRRLLDRLAVLEQEQHTKRQLELLLTELTDSKGKLAYEKGKLETRVSKLQSELQSASDSCSENSKLRKLNSALELKYTQMTSELDSCKIRLQRTETKLQQSQNFVSCKEEAFTLAVQARDEAIGEEEKLREQMKALKEKEEHNRAILQQQLSDICEERSRMSETLENVLSSHTKLQKDSEKLQTDLGHRDADIINLHNDRANLKTQIQKLETELSECQIRLQSAESEHYGKIEPLKKSIETTREDNRNLAQALHQALQKNNLLHNHVKKMVKELQNKEAQEKQLHVMKAQAEEEVRLKQQLLEERLISLSKQHQLEFKEAKKIARKETSEMKKALDLATAKLAEVSRANRELRTRESLLQQEVLQKKDAICGLKIQLRSYMLSKGGRNQADKIQELETQLKSIQKTYEMNSNEQCRRVQEFMSEVDCLRKEITAASSWSTQEHILQDQMEKEVKSKLELEERCKVLEQKVQKLQEKKETNKKLREASMESGKDIPDCNHTQVPYFLLQSTAEHWETKQRLKLISRNALPKESPEPAWNQNMDLHS